MSGVLSYGPDIRDPAGSGTPPRVSRPRSAEVQAQQFTPSRSPAPQNDGWNEYARLSAYIYDRDGRSRSTTSTPQLPTRVSDTLDIPPPDYNSLTLPADPSSSFSSTLPRSVSNPASPSDPPPLGSMLPFPTAGDNPVPTTPFFPFGIVSTDPSSSLRAGRRPLPTIPDTQGAETTNPLPRRVSQVLSDADRPSMIRRAHSDGGPSSTTATQFMDITDLDWVVSTLEHDETAQGVDYETLLTLEEIIGPSAVATAPRRPDPLGRAGLKPSPVTEESRRYNAEGKLKLKLSLGGVRVPCGLLGEMGRDQGELPDLPRSP
ncbi:hypothetical protein FRC05_010088 [Tulasnella sp. 425]|nr:hypothetical protein FRC05_010088 [Tulasnella sp. 425]